MGTTSKYFYIGPNLAEISKEHNMIDNSNNWCAPGLEIPESLHKKLNDKSSEPKSVFVFIISGGEGIDASVYATYELAYSALVAYVTEFWQDVFGKFSIMPSDEQDRIDRYFDEMGERNSSKSEYYDIQERLVINK